MFGGGVGEGLAKAAPTPSGDAFQAGKAKI
jgi:hypothetical protein